MTETTATTTPGAPMFPPGRYGHRREARRRPWLAALLALAAVAAGVLVAVRLYGMYGDPTYGAEVVSYTDITDSQINVHFRVRLPAGGSAVCLVRARARDHSEVGHAEVRVDARPGQELASASHRVVTSARPLVGEVTRCRPA